MHPPCALALTGALLLLGALPSVLAHGDEELHAPVIGDHGAHHSSSMQMTTWNTTSGLSSPPSYFSHPEHSELMLAHIGLMVLSWFVFCPLAVMLSIGRSRLALPTQALFLIINAFGILTSIIYNQKTPDLYENNAHHKAGWAITWIALAWVLMSILRARTKPSSSDTAPQKLAWHLWRRAGRCGSVRPRRRENGGRDRDSSVDGDALGWEGNERDPLRNGRERELFLAGGHAVEATGADHEESHNSDVASTASNSRAISWSSEMTFVPARQDVSDKEDTIDSEDKCFLQSSGVDRSPGRAVFSVILNVLHPILERGMILLGFIAFMTGLVVWGGVARGSNILNVLAHLIKGGIFLGYGLLTFGRWMGCFADFGWAWNIKPFADVVGLSKARVPSAEFTESAVIFLYGFSNVWLEHLAAWGSAWDPMDLEHVSITIMFAGGGMLGMLIESPAIRRMLNSALVDSDDTRAFLKTPALWRNPDSNVHSMNPVPGLVILFLGITMSSHHQHSMVSAAIHSQWGYLFVGFALARGVTYSALWIKPPTSYLPTRPPSEIIASFCLMAGGIIFMSSNKDTVAALESYGLDAMFTFTVAMGLTALLMAWVVFLVAVKGWAVWKLRTQNFMTMPDLTA